MQHTVFGVCVQLRASSRQDVAGAQCDSKLRCSNSAAIGSKAHTCAGRMKAIRVHVGMVLLMPVCNICPRARHGLNDVANCGGAGVLTHRVEGTKCAAFAFTCTPAVVKMLPELSVIPGLCSDVQMLQS